MSDLAQAALISGSIFILVTLRSYGHRTFDRRAVLFPLLMLAGFGYGYLKDMPFASSGDIAAYLVAVAIGLAFGAAAYAVTGMDRDAKGRVFTIVGPGFVAIWGTATVARLAFVWAVSDWSWARMHFGEFMLGHNISLDAVAPFFLVWAMTMVVSRIVALKIREQGLVRAAAAEPELIAA
jgi:hypothetical protein